MDDRFIINDKLKRLAYILTGIGILLTIIGILTDHSIHHAHTWSIVLLIGTFATGIALASTFFVAVHNIAMSAWQTVLKRVPEAIGMTILFALVVMLIFAFGGGMDAVYHHWITDHPDEIVRGKSGFLNKGTYITLMLIYFAGWIGLTYWIRQNSQNEDRIGGTKWYRQSIIISAIYVVFFAITSSTSSWGWLMSIDPHWFSTLFGWYTFSSYLVAAVAVITLMVIYLKGNGYLKAVNDSHLHDLGKYMFAFSLLWSYLWVSQFLLIWYANIPEETHYYIPRVFEHPFLLGVLLFLNFLCPFLIMMTRDAKRNKAVLILMAVVILLGHWLDFFMMIMPGVGFELTFPWLEIGMTMASVGIFILVAFTFLAKAPLVPKNHPYFKESLHHHT